MEILDRLPFFMFIVLAALAFLLFRTSGGSAGRS